MYQLITVIHVMLGLAIIGLIMIQQGKGADAGANFGGGTSGSVFGSQGAGSFLTRTTAVLATLFFITSLGLAFLNARQSPTNDLMQPLSNGQTNNKAEIAKPVETIPTAPEIKTEEKQITEVPAPTPTPAVIEQPETKPANVEAALPSTVVPQPEPVKTVEEKQVVESVTNKIEEPTKADTSNTDKKTKKKKANKKTKASKEN